MEQARALDAPLDVAGIGFGPSNLSLAIYARERATTMRCLYFERNPRVQWHPGMMLDGARMQISFLKDLVTLRNPSSPYSFLHYLKACGRLEHFVNVSHFRPTRVEYDDYLRWVATAFSDQVLYDAQVKRVTPVTGAEGRDPSMFRLDVQDTCTGVTTSAYARNVVYSGGGRPLLPPAVTRRPPWVIHSSEFLHHFPMAFVDRDRSYTFAVVGRGQSAGEIVEYLLGTYDNAVVHFVISGYAPRPTDNSPFVNEQFFSSRVDAFYRYDAPTRAALLHELRDANYGVIREDVLDRLYDAAYLDAVKGRQRLFIESCSRLSSVRDARDGLQMGVVDRFTGSERTLRCDAVILATGYDRTLDPAIFSDVLEYADRDPSGELMLSRNHRVRTAAELQGGFYLQGYGESHFGLGDTLLSLLPFRSKEIFEDICAHSASATDDLCDPDELHAVIEKFPLATVIMASGVDELAATQVPVVLDRSRGAKGVLSGLMSRSNPQAGLVDGRRLLVLFAGEEGAWRGLSGTNGQEPERSPGPIQVRGRAHVVDLPAEVTEVVGFEIEIDELSSTVDLARKAAGPTNLDLLAR